MFSLSTAPISSSVDLLEQLLAVPTLLQPPHWEKTTDRATRFAANLVADRTVNIKRLNVAA